MNETVPLHQDDEKDTTQALKTALRRFH